MAASFCHEMQNIKIHYETYMQWAHCLMVSTVSKATGFYLLPPSRESATKLFCKIVDRRFRLGSKYASVLPLCWSKWNVNETICKVFFSVKLSDNSKIVTVLYYHNRSTIQRDKLSNIATQVKWFSQIQVIVIFGKNSLSPR